MVVTGKGLLNTSAIVDPIVRLPSTSATAFLTPCRRLPAFRFSSRAVTSAARATSAIRSKPKAWAIDLHRGRAIDCCAEPS